MKKRIYFGLFLVTTATLMFEIVLTRIFSVIMWYHFAFVAISVAMFGMTVGALIVYLFPAYFTQENVKQQLAAGALLFSITAVFGLLVQLNIHCLVWGIFSLMSTYTVMSMPFIFSGILVCLALTKFPGHTSKLYAADLAGAAFGCFFIIALLRITDAPTVVIVIAFLSSLASLCFASADDNKNDLSKIAIGFCLVFLFFSVANTILVYQQSPLIRISWAKGHKLDKPLYEKWNQMSCIDVWGRPHRPQRPFMWGPSPGHHFKQKIRQLNVTIDSGAGTIMTDFEGDLNNVQYLKYDITNLAHYLKPDSNVLVIGAGAGRDILSALVFGQKSVVGVEVNEDIVNSVNKKFGDFSGHLDKNPKVHYISDEARSYISRTKDQFDIIELSLVDTWSSAVAGGLVLTENSLYTVEAWKIFLDHLTPTGVLTVSRCYFALNPKEVYRLCSLAAASLMKEGIKDPRNHIFMANSTTFVASIKSGIATMLISKEPFSNQDLDLLEKTVKDMQFEVVLSPRYSIDNNFAILSFGKNIGEFLSKFPVNITAPTDDSPFFFQMYRLSNIFNKKLRGQYTGDKGMQVVFILGDLLMLVGGLTLVCIILPLILTVPKKTLEGALPLSIFFISIGFGFMLIEISQMQRLIIFLGHPIYSLSVVLFTLLLSSSLGSGFTQMVDPGKKKASIIFLSILLGVLLVFGTQTNGILQAFQSCGILQRILVSAAILFPLGFFMGMPFPLVMGPVSASRIFLSPWLWGINGAASVCASVLAVVISMNSGISSTFWTGAFCYLLAFIAIIWSKKQGIHA